METEITEAVRREQTLQNIVDEQYKKLLTCRSNQAIGKE